MTVREIVIAAVSMMMLALSTGIGADTKKKPRPPKPPPTDQELGFVGISRDGLFTSIKRVGVVSVQLPRWADDRPETEKAVREAVTPFLRAAGFDVVGPESYQASFDRFEQQVGGFYDRQTGALKRDAAIAVQQNAIREFIARERLDGYVLLRVIPVSANNRGAFLAQWDGVSDRADGNAPDFVSRLLWTAEAGGGVIPALSLRLQIVTVQDRVVFARNGGLQPTNYWDGFNFRRVPIQDLLRDQVRIERAARVATLPLVKTPREIADGAKDPAINAMWIDLKTLPKLPPPEAGRANSPLRVSREQLLGSVRRVAVSPIANGGFDVSDEARKRWMELVRAELAPLNWELIEAPTANQVLAAKMLGSQLYDPMTGRRDDGRYQEIRRSIFREAGGSPSPDAILWLSLVRVTLQQSHGHAYWDGVNQQVFTRAPVDTRVFSGNEVPAAGVGSIEAVSLSATLTDAQDTELYYSRGGLELVQTLRITTQADHYDADLVDLAPGELFQDATREQPAVHAMLRHLVMTPEALQAELNPDPKADKKRKKK